MKKTDKILIEFVDLLKSWGLGVDDFCFSGEQALVYQGFRMKYRKNHFDFYVNAKKMPWRIKLPSETAIPPRRSKYFRDFQELARKTGVDPHFLPIPLAGFTTAHLVKETKEIQIDERTLRIMTLIGQVKHHLLVISTYFEQGKWSEEKDRRWLSYFKVFRQNGIRLGIPEIVKLSDKAIEHIENRRYKLLRGKKIDHQADLVTGNPVFRGRVSGVVRKVMTKKDYPKVKKGDIVVCDIARWGFAPFVHKIAGMVADQGGTLSHAAVISREFRIPAIIGTKTGTKIFKDGDLVEVDSTKGIVKKVK